ncbi:hypothetical protein PC110_g17999 [Phytophthora cactorum]|uniref:Uncharacterized protein n=1 Tax=Phytophthora cactorum TaxID=29920 RepID=A0A329RPG3_9STRA|nr:hypothetical protein GQ600_22669 [Phytophthora cactorum]RAW25586.1 hypothetical protein PC110_g17999 [Phytophthora cactorum]
MSYALTTVTDNLAENLALLSGLRACAPKAGARCKWLETAHSSFASNVRGKPRLHHTSTQCIGAFAGSRTNYRSAVGDIIAGNLTRRQTP